MGPVLAVAVVLGLAGCSPNPAPYLALTMVDGHPTLLIAECARPVIDNATVAEIDTTASAGPRSPEWWVESPLSTPNPNGVRMSTVDAPAQITFFEKPSGWLVRLDTLQEFRENAEYRVDAGPGNVGPLQFSLGRLRELAPGKVLAAVGYHEQHVVSEAKFDKAAQKECDRPKGP